MFSFFFSKAKMTTVKKLLNSPDTCVADALKGLMDTNPGLIVDVESRIVMVNTVCYFNEVIMLLFYHSFIEFY